MVSLNAHYDGKVIIPDEPLDLAPNQKLRITVEPVEPAARSTNRVPGRQRDALLHIASDFDEHLGDDFWGVEDQK